MLGIRRYQALTGGISEKLSAEYQRAPGYDGRKTKSSVRNISKRVGRRCGAPERAYVDHSQRWHKACPRLYVTLTEAHADPVLMLLQLVRWGIVTDPGE